MESLVEKIAIISGSISLLLLLAECISKGNLPWRLYMVVIYAAHSFFMFFGWMIHSGNLEYASFLFFFAGPLMFWHAWALPRSLRCIVNLSTDQELKRDFVSVAKDSFPCIIVLGIVLIVSIKNFDYRSESLKHILSGSDMQTRDYIPIFVFVSALLYQIYGLGITFGRAFTRSSEKPMKFIMTISGLLILRSTFGLIERLFFRDSLLEWHILIGGIIIPIFFLLYKRFLSYLQKYGYEIQKPYKQSRLGEVDLNQLERRLHNAMQIDRIYTEESLTLAKLAKHTNVTVHQLSEYLNVNKAISFRNYINEWRIGFACELLISKPQMSVLEIAFECGFGAKSTFHTAFQKHMGMHPSRYRNNLSSKLSD